MIDGGRDSISSFFIGDNNSIYFIPLHLLNSLSLPTVLNVASDVWPLLTLHSSPSVNGSAPRPVLPSWSLLLRISALKLLLPASCLLFAVENPPNSPNALQKKRRWISCVLSPQWTMIQQLQQAELQPRSWQYIKWKIEFPKITYQTIPFSSS